MSGEAWDRLQNVIDASLFMNGLNDLRRGLAGYSDEEVGMGWAYAAAKVNHWDRCAEVLMDELARRGVVVPEPEEHSTTDDSKRAELG